MCMMAVIIVVAVHMLSFDMMFAHDILESAVREGRVSCVVSRLPVILFTTRATAELPYSDV